MCNQSQANISGFEKLRQEVTSFPMSSSFWLERPEKKLYETKKLVTKINFDNFEGQCWVLSLLKEPKLNLETNPLQVFKVHYLARRSQQQISRQQKVGHKKHFGDFEGHSTSVQTTKIKDQN